MLRHSTLCLTHIILPWGCAVQRTGEPQRACGNEPALVTWSSGPVWWAAGRFRFSPMLPLPLEKLPVNTCKVTSFLLFPICPHAPLWAQEQRGRRGARQPTRQADVQQRSLCSWDWGSYCFLPGSLFAPWGCLWFRLCSSWHKGVQAQPF